MYDSKVECNFLSNATYDWSLNQISSRKNPFIKGNTISFTHVVGPLFALVNNLFFYYKISLDFTSVEKLYKLVCNIISCNA